MIDTQPAAPAAAPAAATPAPAPAPAVAPSTGPFSRGFPQAAAPPEKEEQQYSVTILVPNEAVGLLIGKGGSTRQELMAQSGVTRLKVQDYHDIPELSTERGLTLTGTYDVRTKRNEMKRHDMIAMVDHPPSTTPPLVVDQLTGNPLPLLPQNTHTRLFPSPTHGPRTPSTNTNEPATPSAHDHHPRPLCPSSLHPPSCSSFFLGYRSFVRSYGRVGGWVGCVDAARGQGAGLDPGEAKAAAGHDDEGERRGGLPLCRYTHLQQDSPHSSSLSLHSDHTHSVLPHAPSRRIVLPAC